VLDHIFLFVPAQTYVAEMLHKTLADFPARQEPASFNIDQVIEKLQAGATSA
jgi:arylsulfatase